MKAPIRGLLSVWHSNCTAKGMYVWPQDQRRSFMANGIALALAGLLLFVGEQLVGSLRPEWLDANDLLIMFWSYSKIVGVFIFAWGSGLVAKSKGYSILWGLMTLPMLLIPGLLLILLLQDKWDPLRREYMQVPNNHLLDGEYYPQDWELKLALRRSFRSKLLWALAMALAWAFLFVVSKQVSSDTSDLFQVSGLLFGLGAALVGLWGGKHLAHYKNWDPLFAGAGLFLMPLLMLIRLGGPNPGYDISASSAAALLGPIFLLLAPHWRHRERLSPFRKDPSSLYLGNLDADAYDDLYSRR